MKRVNTSFKVKHIFLLLVALFCSLQIVSAQAIEEATGVISGKIIDAETGDAIIGANVVVVGTSRGDATDIDGNYSISSIEPGSYKVRVSYISYAKKMITGVQVKAGEVTRLNTSLQPANKNLGEITVTADVNSSSIAGLLSMQRKASAVQDGLSSQQISKQGDSDVADAIKRITGVTVMNDNEVFVRGLGNRYSNVQLNGSQVPSTNPNKKEAPIDLFGSGLVSNIIVQKTFTADQPAEFSGGSVQITTREFPDEYQLNLKYSTSYNTVSTFENMLSSEASSTDFLGYDNGRRAMPSFLENQRLNAQNALQFTRAVHKNWGLVSNKQAVPSQKISIDYANQYNKDFMPIGLVSNFSYGYERRMEPSKISRQLQGYVSSRDFYDIASDYTRTDGIQTAELSGMLNVFMKPSSTTKIGLKNLYSNALTNSYSTIIGTYENYDPNITRQTISDFDRRAIFSSTLEMEVYFDEFYNSRLEGSLSYSLARRYRPDRRTTQYNGPDKSNLYIYFRDNGNTQYWMDQRDNNYAAKLDYELEPVSDLKIKTGFSAAIKYREFNSRFFSYVDRTSPSVSYSERSYSPANILNAAHIRNNTLEIVETTDPEDSYQGDQQTYAGYVSTVWNMFEKFSLSIGARIENFDQQVSYTKTDGSEETVAQLQNVNLLPAVNITYNLSDEINIRAAYSSTLARPKFREISEFSFQNFVGGQQVFGNPGLEQTTVTNYDLRFEVYPNAGELFALSAFYKHFDKPIELLYRRNDRLEVFYENAASAELYGLEIEARKNITDRLQIVANGSYIYSQTRVKPENESRVANPERAMFGQSPYTINLSAFYTFPTLGVDLSASFNTFGKRITTVGKIGQGGDEYEQPFHNLGAKLDYTLGAATLSLEASNLLNDVHEYKQAGLTTYRYKPGITFELGVQLSLK